MADSSATCRNCRFWSPSHPAFREQDRGGQYCRRRAPVCVSDTREALWPLTKAADWCGEFERFNLVPATTEQDVRS